MPKIQSDLLSFNSTATTYFSQSAWQKTVAIKKRESKKKISMMKMAIFCHRDSQLRLIWNEYLWSSVIEFFRSYFFTPDKQYHIFHEFFNKCSSDRAWMEDSNSIWRTTARNQNHVRVIVNRWLPFLSQFAVIWQRAQPYSRTQSHPFIRISKVKINEMRLVREQTSTVRMMETSRLFK